MVVISDVEIKGKINGNGNKWKIQFLANATRISCAPVPHAARGHQVA